MSWFVSVMKTTRPYLLESPNTRDTFYLQYYFAYLKCFKKTRPDQNGHCVSSPCVCAGNSGVCLPHHLHNRDLPEDRCLWSGHAPELLRPQRLEHVGLCHRRRGVSPVHRTQHNVTQHLALPCTETSAHTNTNVHTLCLCVNVCGDGWFNHVCSHTPQSPIGLGLGPSEAAWTSHHPHTLPQFADSQVCVQLLQLLKEITWFICKWWRVTGSL